MESLFEKSRAGGGDFKFRKRLRDDLYRSLQSAFTDENIAKVRSNLRGLVNLSAMALSDKTKDKRKIGVSGKQY
jgi:hypothetical protein